MEYAFEGLFVLSAHALPGVAQMEVAKHRRSVISTPPPPPLVRFW